MKTLLLIRLRRSQSRREPVRGVVVLPRISGPKSGAVPPKHRRCRTDVQPLLLSTERPLRTCFRARIRVEHVLLFGWLVLQPIVLPQGAEASGQQSRPDIVGGLFDLTALLLAAACLASAQPAGRRDRAHAR